MAEWVILSEMVSRPREGIEAIRYLCGIVSETVCPHEVEIILEIAFRLV